MDKKVIIFDFDGVIADSFETVVSIVKKIAGFSFNKDDRELSKKGYSYFRNLSSDELYFSMPKWKLFMVVIYSRIRLARLIAKIKPIEGIKKEIAKIKSNYTLGIVSSNSAGNINKFLKINNLDCFDFVYSSSVFMKKEKRLRKIISDHKFLAEDVIFIGDETRDIEAARKAGLKNISVSWGFTLEAVLNRYNPNYLINKPTELSKIINTIFNLRRKK